MTDPNNHEAKEGSSGTYQSPDEILAVLHEVRRAFTEIICSAGADPDKARAMSRQLDLSYNIVWPISRFITAEDIVAATCEVLGRAKFSLMCDACEELGAAPDTVETARLATEKLNKMIKLCAGSRDNFIILLGGLVDEDVTERQEAMRKQAFIVNSSLWGIQARFNFKTVIFAPNAEHPDYLDAIRLYGMIDFRRLRNVPWPLYRLHGYNDDGSIREGTSNPIETPPTSHPELPLLEGFCSTPIPNIQAVDRPYGKRLDLCEGPIGRAGETSCVIADRLLVQQTPYKEPGYNEVIGGLLELVTPVENVMFDIFVPKDFPGDEDPQAHLVDRLSSSRGFDPTNFESRDLPFTAKVQKLESSISGCATDRYPAYLDLLAHVMGRTRLSIMDFVGYRIMMPYPQIPTALTLTWPLPNKPD